MDHGLANIAHYLLIIEANKAAQSNGLTRPTQIEGKWQVDNEPTNGAHHMTRLAPLGDRLAM